MKIKISDIECPKCHKEIEVEVGGYDFGYESYPAGCDCCSDEVKVVVDFVCPECGKWSDMEIK